ncbi:MAG: hypothetical protein QM606_05990 [Leucobacter sp.]
MTLPEHVRVVADALCSSASLMRSGASARDLARRRRSDALVQVARGWFVAEETWSTWFPEARHLAAVLAVHSNAKEPPLFSHYSAAVLHGLPLWNLRSQNVHTVSRSHNCDGRVTRHLLDIADHDIVEIAGLRCTGLDRTLADLSRIAGEELLWGCADAVLRGIARTGRRVDLMAWRAWQDRMRERADASAGNRGVRLLRRVVELADPRADSVLESVSRLQFDRLGIPVELQTPIPSPDGGLYHIDFKLLGLGVWGEADGDFKYTDPALLAQLSPGEAALREKRRDNWISGTTGDRMIHWGSRAPATTDRFAAMLRSFNVPIPQVRTSHPRRTGSDRGHAR